MTAVPVDVKHVVITAEKLQKKLSLGRDVVVLDVRRHTPAAERIPIAHAVVLTPELAQPSSPGAGNHPLPTEERLQDAVRRWGINEDSIVVVYSSENPALAARGWWTLRWAGVPDVRYLDGGVDAWAAAGGTLSAEAPAEGDGTFVVRTGSLPTLDADAAAALAGSGILLDARGAEGYEAGHIPGALLAPGGRNLGADGRLKSDEELREQYAALGVGLEAGLGAGTAAGAGADGNGKTSGPAPVGAYCGGGTAASLDVLALARLGVEAALYPGSFSAWSSDPARPVATGAAAG